MALGAIKMIPDTYLADIRPPFSSKLAFGI